MAEGIQPEADTVDNQSTPFPSTPYSAAARGAVRGSCSPPLEVNGVEGVGQTLWRPERERGGCKERGRGSCRLFVLAVDYVGGCGGPHFIGADSKSKRLLSKHAAASKDSRE